MISSLDHARKREAGIPPTRDPFVNTPLLPLGPGADGEDRFWISSWNNHTGCMGMVVDTRGRAVRHDFTGERFAAGFYSAVAENEHTLWLCNWLDEVCRYDLNTQAFERYETSAPRALMFQGMALDRETGKLLALAHPPPLATAFVFDTRTCQPVKVVSDICPDKYMRYSWRTSDGIWHALIAIPGCSILHWDPRTDELTYDRLAEDHDTHAAFGYLHLFCRDDRCYLPGYGWHGANGFEDGPRPMLEADWLGQIDDHVYGIQRDGSTCAVVAWTLATGHVETLFTVNDMTIQGFALTRNGQLASFSIYGEFRLFDLPSGALRVSRWLDTDRVQQVDHILRVADDRVLGTPFIAQRFWEVDLRTGQGRDCGRAAPGGGQITRTWRLGEMIYMASYTTGSLMAYDPGQPVGYPQNPRVVARPPHGMRPIASTDDGRTLYYSSNKPYGQLGCELTAYDTATGMARYAENPVPDEAVTSLWYLPTHRQLLGSTQIQADCGSAPPSAAQSSWVLIDADSLALVEQQPGLPQTERAVILGPLDDARWLALCVRDNQSCFAILSQETLQAEATTWPVTFDDIYYAGQHGWFILLQGQQIELWDMREPTCHAVLYRGEAPCRARVSNGDLFILLEDRFLLYEDFLSS